MDWFWVSLESLESLVSLVSLEPLESWENVHGGNRMVQNPSLTTRNPINSVLPWSCNLNRICQVCDFTRYLLLVRVYVFPK